MLLCCCLVLVTLLAWLLPTLVIVGGLLDGLFVLHLVEGKATKGNKLMKGKQKKKGLKDAKVSSTFEVQAASTHQQNRNQSCGAFCLSWIAMTYYYEATSLLNQDTLYQL